MNVIPHIDNKCFSLKSVYLEAYQLDRLSLRIAALILFCLKIFISCSFNSLAMYSLSFYLPEKEYLYLMLNYKLIAFFFGTLKDEFFFFFPLKSMLASAS